MDGGWVDECIEIMDEIMDRCVVGLLRDGRMVDWKKAWTAERLDEWTGGWKNDQVNS